MQITNGKKVALCLPFIVLSVILFWSVNPDTLEGYTASLISTSLAIATFSITFSFLQYQFSPYKVLLKSISIRQLYFAYLTIFISLIPLFTLFVDAKYSPVVSLFVIPILAYATLLLLFIANEESNPRILLSRKILPDNLTAFLLRYEDEIKNNIDSQKRLEFSKPQERPSHDFGDTKYYYDTIAGDPFNLLNNIVDVSIKNADIDVYSEMIDRFLYLVDCSLGSGHLYTLDMEFRINHLLQRSFLRISASTKQAENIIFTNRFIDSVSRYLKIKALVFEQTKPPYDEFVAELTNFAITRLEKGHEEAALRIVSLFRELAQKGIYDNPKGDEHFMFDIHLNSYAIYLKQIGQASIRLKRSDFLYRCLEEIGYLGCSAIKSNHQVGIECLQGLVQLGREARANNIKCFYRHCLLESIDHADERIWWMLSWVPHLEEEQQKQWIRSFEMAYSRLHGLEREILTERSENGRNGFAFRDGKEPYKEHFMKDQYRRVIDYSDVNEIKEFKLY